MVAETADVYRDGRHLLPQRHRLPFVRWLRYGLPLTGAQLTLAAIYVLVLLRLLR